MSVKILITIRGDSLQLEGDVALAEVLTFVREWYAARTIAADLTARLTASTDDLAAALAADSDRSPTDTHFTHFAVQGDSPMAVPQILTDLDDEVTRATSVQAGAATLIRGFATRQQAAIDAALANGATAEQLAPVQAEVDALKAGTNDLSAAIAENTPAA